MRFAFLTAVLSLIFIAGFSPESRADYAVWQDPETGVSLTFPDTWMRVNNAQPDDVLTIRAPSGRGHAMCRIRARDDGRYTIYPPRFDRSIQKVAYSRAFWDAYLGEYDNVAVEDFHDDAALGLEDASFVRATYDAAGPGGTIMPRKMMALAGRYYDTAYIFECSSQVEAFGQWRKLFYSIAGSVEFRKIQNEFKKGYLTYRIGGPWLKFESPDGKYILSY